MLTVEFICFYYLFTYIVSAPFEYLIVRLGKKLMKNKTWSIYVLFCVQFYFDSNLHFILVVYIPLLPPIKDRSDNHYKM